MQADIRILCRKAEALALRCESLARELARQKSINRELRRRMSEAKERLARARAALPEA